jgi:hypothetical protein
MDTTLRPISNRERVITGFNGIPSFISKILERTAPHLQVQYNDTNNKCIGKSPVLRPEIKITKAGHLHQTTFIPKNTNDPDLKIPNHAKSVVIFGQQGNFASIEDAMAKLCPKPFDPTYRPTCGIKMSGPFHLGQIPMKLVLAQFDLQSGERISQKGKFCNDIIETIQFKNGVFTQLTTTESVNYVSRY